MLERGARAPDCFGSFDANDRVCTGRRSIGEPACLFRDRCLAARLAVEDGLIPAHALVRRGHVIVDGLGERIAEALFKYQVRDGAALRRAPGKPRLVLGRLMKAPSERHALARAMLDRLVSYYFRRIAKLSGLELFETRRVAEPRSLYIDDFEDDYGYTSLGYRAPERGYNKVTRIWKRQYGAKRLTLDLPWIRAQIEQNVDKKSLNGLRFMESSSHSALATRVANVGRIAVDAFAEMLGSDIKSGAFDRRRHRPKELA